MIGQRIKEQRELLGITQEELGKACGTTKQTIFKYESGIVTNIPMDRLIKISSILRTTPAWLMGWDDEGSPVPKIRSMDLSPLEADLIDSCRQLNDDGCKKVLDYAEDLAASGKYRK